jgi:glycosyltransferase involved in cell wall biosynthesis
MIDLEKLRRITDSIPSDTGGGSSFAKVSLVAALAELQRLTTFIEIGVYRGRSFFPIAWSFARRQGMSFGVDPYTRAAAIEADLPGEVADTVRRFIETTDYERLYREAQQRLFELGLQGSAHLLRLTSDSAIEMFRRMNTQAGLVHVDGNHDTRCVTADVANYVPLLREGGLLVLDDINWSSVQPAFQYCSERLDLIHRSDTFAIFARLADKARADELRRAAARLADRSAEPEPSAISPARPTMSASSARSRRFKRIRRFIRDAIIWQSHLPAGMMTGTSCRLDLLVLDDAYPHPQSAFRREEFDAYLKEFPLSAVHTSGVAFSFFKNSPPLDEAIRERVAASPELKDRILPFDRGRPLRARLGYTIFAHNAGQHVEFFERNRIPFIFTLYPGGGFLLENEESDEGLRRIFNSPMFRRVITTQKLTSEYIVRKRFVSPEKIHFIYGVVTPEAALRDVTARSPNRSRFGFGKETLDVCFTAHKYMPTGRDKGYDFFLDVARKLLAAEPRSRFHVVGGFAAEDLPIDGLEGRIHFYGGRNPEWFADFYRDKDLMVLGNVPFVLLRGAFDGFPTGCGSDAMLSELALFCTDPLNLNCEFVDGRDLVIIPRDVDAVVEKILHHRDRPGELKKLGERARKEALRVYSRERQILPRIEILRSELSKQRS